MSKAILSIDKGSTNIKAVLFDLDGNELTSAIRRYDQIKQPHPGWNEQDMNRLWVLTIEAIREVLQGGIDPSDIISIGVSGQGNGLSLIDGNGNPVRDAILSVDSRAQYLVEKWFEDGTYQKAKKTSGLSMYAATPCPLLRWLKENENEVYRKFRWLIFSKDWLKVKLTGTICTDPSDASGAALMDIAGDGYSEDIFKTCGISECFEKLPKIIPTMEVCGLVTQKASEETGLKKGTPVVSGAHDIAACSFGAGGINEGHLTIVIGTLGLNLLVLREPSDEDTGQGIIHHAIPERWLAINCELSSGSSLDWFINVYCQDELKEAKKKGLSIYHLLEGKIKDVSSRGLIYHPFINGRIDQNAARAGFYGLGAWHRKEDVIKAVYEGIAFAHCQLIEEDFKDKVNINSVWLVGGGARSQILGQIIAHTLGTPISIPATGETTARGVALSAGVGAGVYKGHEVDKLAQPEVWKQYTPDEQNRENLEDKYKIFKKISHSMRNVWEDMLTLSTKV